MSVSNRSRQKKRKATPFAVEEGDKVEQTTDEKYSNDGEVADLVIVSSDNVRFYVQKFFVLAASTVFRSMIQDCASDPAEVQLTDDGIERASIIRLLLDLACGKEFDDFDEIPSNDVFDLIALCDKYDCAAALYTIKLLVSQPLTFGNNHNAYRFFYACVLDDLGTAHRVLPAAACNYWTGESTADSGVEHSISSASCLDLTSLSIEWQNRLPRKYYYALLRASRLRLNHPQGSWHDVADDFKKQVELQDSNNQ